MKKKINVFIFANDDKVKRKALQMIDNIPCLVRIIRAFQELSGEFLIRFIVYCHYEEIEYIEDEMSRWLDNMERNILYFSVETRNMQSSFFYNYIHSNFFQSTNYVYITSLHFPLVDATMIKTFLDAYTNKPVLLCANFHKKMLFWKQYFPSIETKENNLVTLQWNKDNNAKFLYSCIMDDTYFQNLFNIPSNLVYYHCLLWNTFYLPKFFFHHEALPFVKENDVQYLESSCVRKKELDLSLYLQRFWNKLVHLEERVSKLSR